MNLYTVLDSGSTFILLIVFERHHEPGCYKYKETISCSSCGQNREDLTNIQCNDQ
jgi:hypothetical protein